MEQISRSLIRLENKKEKSPYDKSGYKHTRMKLGKKTGYLTVDKRKNMLVTRNFNKGL